MRLASTRSRVLSATLAAALVLGACSDDDGDEDPVENEIQQEGSELQSEAEELGDDAEQRLEEGGDEAEERLDEGADDAED